MTTLNTTNQQPSIMRMFYTHSRTKALLGAKGIKVKSIEKVSITKPDGSFYSCVQVVYTTAAGLCSTFISCREYLGHAMQGRKERARDYTATQGIANPQQWKVTSNELGCVPKTVTTTQHGVSCTCEDFNHQADYLSQHPYLWQKVIKGYSICKHSFATLSQLGFGSLRDYLNAWKDGGRLSNLAATMNRTTRARAA